MRRNGERPIGRTRRAAPEDYAVLEAVGLAGREGARILDVGCSDGSDTVLRFGPYTSVASVVGIDPSEEAIEKARGQTNDARFSFHCADLASYTPDGSFDLVCLSHVLRYLSDPQAALGKVYGLLDSGGFVVVRTADDAATFSCPDPADVMGRSLMLHDRHLCSDASWTSCVDRRVGGKCHTFLKRAGFANIRVHAYDVDTAGKSLEERRTVLERFVEDHRSGLTCTDSTARDELRRLADSWGDLLARDDYCLLSRSLVFVAQKLEDDRDPWAYGGPVFGRTAVMREDGAEVAGRGPDALEATPSGSRDSTDSESARVGGAPVVRAMDEEDLGGIMAIEMGAFRDPWTPLAFALDMRHNRQAHYVVAVVPDGGVVGYLGWWDTPEGAALVRVATASAVRRTGVGRALVAHAVSRARDAGHDRLTLEVRASNEGARAFYENLGFQVTGVKKGYYDDPVEDAVLMVLPCGR